MEIGPTPTDASLLEQQKQYYRERAPEYDDWWYRRGRYDLGAEHLAVWTAEQDELRTRLSAFLPVESLLELAGGTGTWSEVLALGAQELTVVDSSPEVLELNRAKTSSLAVQSPVDYIVADIFDLDLGRTFDAIFFSFWLSHVPDDRFDEFWRTVERHLAPAGRVCLFDSAPPNNADAGASNDIHVVSSGTSRNDLAAGTATRTLADGREFDIVKRFWRPEDLRDRLHGLGWAVDVVQTGRFFVHAAATRR